MLKNNIEIDVKVKCTVAGKPQARRAQKIRTTSWYGSTRTANTSPGEFPSADVPAKTVRQHEHTKAKRPVFLQEQVVFDFVKTVP